MTDTYGVVMASTENLGDDIQSLAALGFLPKLDVIINRDYPRSSYTVKAVFNGWYTHEPWRWAVSSTIIPLFVSMHIADFAFPILLARQTVRRVLIRHGPVGTRDLFTLGVLRAYGVPAYFTGCLTLTLSSSYNFLRRRRQDYILVADLLADVSFIRHNSEVRLASQLLYKTLISYGTQLPQPLKRFSKKVVPSAVIDNVNYRLQLVSARRLNAATRLIRALQRVAEIAGASLVVTSRLHVALPALAFDVPVVFVHENLRDPRFWGLTDFMNVYTPKRFRDLMEGGRLDPKDFGIPKYERLQELKTQLVERVKEFVREE